MIFSIRQLLEVSCILLWDIVGIGVDRQSWSMVPVNGQGNPLLLTPIEANHQAGAECKDMTKQCG